MLFLSHFYGPRKGVKKKTKQEKEEEELELTHEGLNLNPGEGP